MPNLFKRSSFIHDAWPRIFTVLAVLYMLLLVVCLTQPLVVDRNSGSYHFAIYAWRWTVPVHGRIYSYALNDSGHGRWLPYLGALERYYLLGNIILAAIIFGILTTSLLLWCTWRPLKWWNACRQLMLVYSMALITFVAFVVYDLDHPVWKGDVRFETGYALFGAAQIVSDLIAFQLAWPMLRN